MKVIKRGKTSNYDMFCMKAGNRIYKEQHAAKLAKSISKNNMLEANEIMCVQEGKRLAVIDGQHRLGAAKMLKIEIPYVIVEGVTCRDISRLNAGQKGWGTIDFLHHFCALGKTEYLKLAEFVKETGMPVTLSVSVLSGSVPEGGNVNMLEQFRDGKFEIANIDLARKIHSCLSKMKNHGCTFSCDRSLVKAIVAIVEHIKRFDAEKFAMKLDCRPLCKRSNWIDYINQIEEIYNYRLLIDARIFINSELQTLGVIKK